MDEFKPSTRYKDYVGELEIEEFHDTSEFPSDLLKVLATHAGLPAGYRAIGFSIDAALSDNADQGILSFKLIAVFEETVGSSDVEWKRYVTEHGLLPSTSFNGTINFDDFRKLLGTIEVCVRIGTLAGWKIGVQPFHPG